MHPHHIETIRNVTAHFERDSKVLALILAGSIAHGFEAPSSDVDVMIVLSDADHAARTQIGRSTYHNEELATYPGGFIDGKFTSVGFIREVAERGSEPARYGFKDARILFNRIPDLPDAELDALMRRAALYPVAEKKERLKRFRTQFAAWHWYACEARTKGNRFLLNLAVAKLTLFGIRLIMADNEALYPFHKWALKELERVQDKPDGVVQIIERVNEDPSESNVEGFWELIKNYKQWEEGMPPDGWKRWGAQFMVDVELTWLNGSMSVDDV
jgi:predicted nucleotidyltransferase